MPKYRIQIQLIYRDNFLVTADNVDEAVERARAAFIARCRERGDADVEVTDVHLADDDA